MSFKSIAIDGPSGAGKSTLAKMLATKLGYLYVDTGAIYRTVGLYAYRKGVEPTNGSTVTALLGEISVDLKHGEDGLQHMYLNGEDVTGEIRRHEISHYASAVSAIPEVRDFLLEMQRDFAKRYSIIMDGRDIGTVVLPDADVKIFLTAQSEDRAKRRYAELLEGGQNCEYETILADIIERDRNDTNRAFRPLRPAVDAISVDTTDLTLEESFQVLYKIVRERIGL